MQNWTYYLRRMRVAENTPAQIDPEFSNPLGKMERHHRMAATDSENLI